MEPGPRGKFAGFTIPDGAWIPPEMIFILPRLTESQLKVLLVMVYNDLQTGGSEPTSLGTLEVLTGLARSSIHAALASLQETGLIEARMIGKIKVYSASVRISDTKLSKLSSKKVNDINLLTDSLNSDDCTKFGLVSELRTLGVYFQTARKIVEEFDEETIRKHVGYFAHALEKRLASGPGWLVLSLREGWGPPLGYEEAEEKKTYNGGEFAEFIRS